MQKQVFLESNSLSIYVENRVCWIVFSASPTKNAISVAIAKALHSLFSHAKSSSGFLAFCRKWNAQTLVLKSAVPGVFVSGGDLKELAGLSNQAARSYAKDMRTFCRALRSIPMISIALLEGPAFGGGAEVALAADYRWTTKEGALHFWQSKWHVPGGWDGMARLSQIVPQWDSREVGIRFALQSSLHFSELLEMNIASLLPEDLHSALEELANRLEATSEPLRSDLLARKTCADYDKLLKADEKLFEKYWMKKLHRSALIAFLNRRNSK